MTQKVEKLRKPKPAHEREPSRRDDMPLLANMDAEASLCQLALTIGDTADELKTLEPADFFYDVTRFVFFEVMGMIAAGYPPGDKAAVYGWFNGPEAIARCKEAKLDEWFSVNGTVDAASKIIEIIFGPDLLGVGMAVSGAHIGFYIAELRKWRKARWARRFAYELVAKVEDNPNDIDATCKWAFAQCYKFSEKANSNGK